MSKNKISICTVCMNRLHHIKKTLPINIINNLEYENVEFVLLDYGSTDGLYNWVKSEMSNYIETGILKYYYNQEPKYFDRSHSRNMMFKLSSGDIISNVDADNYTGKDFAKYVNEIFSQNENVYLVADTLKRYYFLRNAFGRFSIRKEDFELLGGLDELMKSYGSETLDFYERLNLAGKKEIIIEDISYLNTISHSDEERISNEFFIKNLESIYIHYVSTNESELVVFYKDNTFEFCSIIPEKNIVHLPAALKDFSHVSGTWEMTNQTYLLNDIDKSSFESISENEHFFTHKPTDIFYKITDDKFILQIAKNFSFITNTEQLGLNKSNKIFKANNGFFGKGRVQKNFKETIIIE